MQLYYFATSSAPILCAIFSLAPFSFTRKIRFIAHSVSQLKVSLALKSEGEYECMVREEVCEEKNESEWESESSKESKMCIAEDEKGRLLHFVFDRNPFVVRGACSTAGGG